MPWQRDLIGRRTPGFPVGRLCSVICRTRAGRRWGRISEIDLWQLALGFAALGFLTLVPLLIVVSAADTSGGRGFAQWLGDGLGPRWPQPASMPSGSGCRCGYCTGTSP